MPGKFPFRVTLLLWSVLIFIAWNLLRVWTALSWRGVLSKFQLSPSLWVIAVSGLFWALCGIFLLYGIWREKAWARKLLIGSVAGYTVWFWCERFLYQMPRPNWLFTVILNLIAILLIRLTINSLQREAYEREPEHHQIEST
ncbi:MAG: hypothetical protein IT310_09875 [Anaerolineales bacterium]|nr:hypothetical protein [Anaerolineales bacterium]